jgi:serine/threonine-protein kinase
MNEPHDPDRTVDVPSIPSDSLDAGLAAGFGPPRSNLGAMRPVLLKEAEGESGHIVQPKSDAMPPPEQAGDRYQLQGEIARGGMGAVLRGRDVDLGRDLAVKVLLEQHAHRPEVARRFIEEAQIGGQLQHPGVVPVYDIGRFGDRPFFTMKLVKGQTLAHLLAERADYTQDRPRYLAIALQVAQTLAYAHAKGVIHRDLKPANSMVGAFGEVQVMDWGLAKVLAEGGIADEQKASRAHQVPEDVTTIRTARGTGSGVGTDTEAGSLLGTPAYMPPEQANGDVANLDRRADVFGLGAILCEILTGKPPYVGRSFEEVRRKACNGDLADATARLDACQADAELIVLTKRCLAAEAIDPPKDAQAVADGLAANLNGVQERLHQAELAEAEAKAKAVEEAKRRRLTLALAGTVLLALTLGGGGWLWVKNERDARQAQVTRDVNDALNQATALREQAKATPVGSAALFAQAREQVQRALALVENGPADDTLKTQVTRLQTEVDEEEKDRQLVAALDEARLAQAEVSGDKRRFATERAVPRFREAFRAYGLPPGEGEPTLVAERILQRPAAVREAILAALDEWDALAADKKLGVSEPHQEWLREVLAAAEPAEGWMSQLRSAREDKDEAKRRAALEKLAAADNVGTLPVRALTRLARDLQKVEAHASAARLLRRAQEQYPADFWINMDLAKALEEVTPPERDEVARFRTAAVALRPDSPGAYLNLGFALEHKGQLDEAIRSFRKAIELDPKFAMAHSNLGAVLDRKGQLDDAIASCRKAIALDPKFASAHLHLGVALEHKGQLDEAIRSYRKAIELDPKFAGTHSNLGLVLAQKGQLGEAVASCRKAIELDPMSAGAHYNLGIVLKAKGQVDEAIASYQKAVALDPKYAVAQNNLGNLLWGRGQVDGAIACYREAVEADPKYPLARCNLGQALGSKGQLDEAIFCFQKAVAIDPNYATAHLLLGAALADKGQLDEGIACLRKALALDPKLTHAHYNLGNALNAKGKVEEAIACYQNALALDPKFAEAYSNLGFALEQVGKQKEAIEAWREAVRLNPRLGEAQYRLGKALLLQGRASEAFGPLQEAAKLLPASMARAVNLPADLLAAARTALPKDSPQLAGILAQAGLRLLQQQKWAEAEPLIRESLAIREKMQPDDWTTFNTKSMLGGALLGQKKYAEAEPLLLAGYEGMKRRQQSIPPPATIRLPEAALRLVQLYEATGKTDDAARWRKQWETTAKAAQRKTEKP